MKEEQKKLVTGIRAGYSFFYARTNEIERAVEKIKEAINQEDAFKNNPYKLKLWNYEESPDPEKLLFEEIEGSQARTIFIAKNFNWFFQDEFKNTNKQFLTYFQNRLERFSTTEERKVFIILSDASFDSAIPEVLQRDFMLLEFDLPDKEEIKAILNFILDSTKEKNGFKNPDEEETKIILESAKGMTAREIQNAFAYSVISDSGTIKAKTIADIRAKNIEASAGLSVCKYSRGFESLKGLDNIKAFTSATIKKPDALGIMLVGPPGTGEKLILLPVWQKKPDY